ESKVAICFSCCDGAAGDNLAVRLQDQPCAYTVEFTGNLASLAKFSIKAAVLVVARQSKTKGELAGERFTDNNGGSSNKDLAIRLNHNCMGIVAITCEAANELAACAERPVRTPVGVVARHAKVNVCA